MRGCFIVLKDFFEVPKARFEALSRERAFVSVAVGRKGWVDKTRARLHRAPMRHRNGVCVHGISTATTALSSTAVVLPFCGHLAFRWSLNAFASDERAAICGQPAAGRNQLTHFLFFVLFSVYPDTAECAK